MKAARTGGMLLYRSPAAVGNQEDRTVSGGGRRNRRVLVEDLEAVQLHDVLVVRAHVGIELLEREVLEIPHGGGRVGIDADRVPGLEHLGPELENLAAARPEFERTALRPNGVHERRRLIHTPPSVAIANGTGAKVARNRATC